MPKTPEGKPDLVIRNIGQLLPMDGAGGFAVEEAALAVAGGKVAWAGEEALLPDRVTVGGDAVTVDAAGGVVTPGFVECHTHLVFAGSRAREFEMRMEGRPYLEILEAGGGILSTVRATRAASDGELERSALERIGRLLAFGVTTCEAKSGYGLSTEAELRILRVVRSLGGRTAVRLVPTFLGAHAVPPEHRENKERYVDLVVEEMIPAVAAEGLAAFCDVYIERGAFDYAETERILTAARAKGLGLKLHAGQFEDLGGAGLGARLGAASVDHLEKVSDAGLAAMARAGTVAVLLPGAAFCIRERMPDARRIKGAGVRVAVSTDLNPGTSMTENLPLMMTMAVVNGGMAMEDAMRAVTVHAAAALALGDGTGTLAPGAPADFVIHRARDWREIAYHFGAGSAESVYIGGRKAK